MGSTGRARIVVVADHAAATLDDCLDGVRALDLSGVDVVVVDLDSSDGSADVAIRHAVADRVVVVPGGDRDRVLDAAATDLGLRHLVVLPADRRPTAGWLDAALRALEDAWVVLGPDGDLDQLAIDRVHLPHLALAGASGADDLERRVRAAGGLLTVAPDMRTEPARRGLRPAEPAPTLPPSPREPAHLPRFAGRITVVLCTRDRPAALARCLRSVEALDDPSHEVVVVDNHDRPTVTVEAPSPVVRVVHEPRRGLDVARNRGLAEARGEVVAFVDDDCEVDPGWLDALRVAFAAPEVDAVTGRVRPASLAAPAQRWFEVHFGFDRGTVARRFTAWDRRAWFPLWMGGVGTGCNMAFRRQALVDLGGFDEVLDMGTAIGGGGDLDAFARLIDRGGVIHYTPSALVWHHHRATEAAAQRQFWGYGVSVGALLTKTVIERPHLRLAAVRFFLDRLRTGARTLRQARAGMHVLPTRLALVDLAGQLAGVVVYLGARSRAGARRR